MSVVASKILLLIFSLVGLLGTILPSLPGLIIIWLTALVYGYLTNFMLITPRFMIYLTAIALIGQGLGYLFSLIGAKVGGASKRGIFGALAGAVGGLLLLGPIGLLVGPFVGAVLLELGEKEFSQAFRAGLGALFGAMGGMVMEFVAGLAMIFIIISAIF